MNRRTFLMSSAGAVLSAPFISTAGAHHEKIRIGQIGTKHGHASGKMKAMRNQPENYEVVGIVEPDAKQKRDVKDDSAYQGIPWMSEAQLLNTPGLKAVAIETAVGDLIPTAYRCIAAGVHIHLDKPAGDSLPRFRRLLKQAEAGRQTVQMGYMLRYNLAFKFMYQAVREGWFGSIMEIDCMMGKLGDEDLRRGIGLFSGGGMFELGGHVIDSIVHMIGKPDAVSAFTRRTQPDGVADNQLAVLEYKHATAGVRINHRDPYGFPRRRFQIAGDKGGMEIQQLESGDFTLYLEEARGGYEKGVHQVSLGKDGRYDGEFYDLAKVIRGEKELAWSYQHDLDTHETLLRASEMPIG